MGGGINQTCKSAESPESFKLQAPPLLQMRTPAPPPSVYAPTWGSRHDATPGARGEARRTPEWEVLFKGDRDASRTLLKHHELGNFTASFIQGQLTREGGATASNAMKYHSLLIPIRSHG